MAGSQRARRGVWEISQSKSRQRVQGAHSRTVAGKAALIQHKASQLGLARCGDLAQLHVDMAFAGLYVDRINLVADEQELASTFYACGQRDPGFFTHQVAVDRQLKINRHLLASQFNSLLGQRAGFGIGSAGVLNAHRENGVGWQGDALAVGYATGDVDEAADGDGWCRLGGDGGRFVAQRAAAYLSGSVFQDRVVTPGVKIGPIAPVVCAGSRGNQGQIQTFTGNIEGGQRAPFAIGQVGDLYLAPVVAGVGAARVSGEDDAGNDAGNDAGKQGEDEQHFFHGADDSGFSSGVH